MLLLAAMVGCIVIAMRSKPKTEQIKEPPVTEIPREETITIHEVIEEV
jgi:hypothetical protein